MKTLKRSLALVLAVVMCLGFVAMSAGAAFVDEEEITYSQAVNTLAELGVLKGDADTGAFRPQDPISREFVLGPTLAAKGQRVLQNIDSRELIRPHLRYLSDKYNENAMLMTQCGNAALISDYCEAKVPVRLAMRLSQLHEMYYGAAPKVILAYKDPEEQVALIDQMNIVQHTAATVTSKEMLYQALEKIKKAGYCYSGGEFANDGIGIAVPVWDGSKTLIGSIAMNVPMFRVESSPLGEMIHDMKLCSIKVAVAMGAKREEIEEMIRLDHPYVG